MSFGPVLPPTSAKPPLFLTLPLEKLWNLSWEVHSLNGHGQRHHYPATVVGLTSGVLPYMPQPPSWRPTTALGHWLRACLDTHRAHPLTPTPLCPPSQPLHPDQIGSVWRVDVPIKQQPLSAAIDEALHQHLLSTVPSVRARLICPASRWQLAQRHSIFYAGSAPSRPGVSVLSALLAGSTPSQLPLLLSRMP